MTILTSMTRRSAASLIANPALYSAAAGQPAKPSAATAELVARLDRLTFASAAPAALAIYESQEVWRKAAIAGVSTTANGDILLTVPRWLDARVPASLVRLTAAGTLVPWPDAAAHELTNSAGLRSVLGLQRDIRGRVWALDMGWVAGEQGPIAPGAAKLVALDSATGAELQRISLDGVAGPGSFLNDIAVDTARNVAFISDSGVRGGPENPTAIIVVDLLRGTARRVLERHVSTANNRAVALTASGEDVFPGNPLQVGVPALLREVPFGPWWWAYGMPSAALGLAFLMGSRHLGAPLQLILDVVETALATGTVCCLAVATIRTGFRRAAEMPSG